MASFITSFTQGVVVYKDGRNLGYYPYNCIDSVVFCEETPTDTHGNYLIDPYTGSMLSKVLQMVAIGASNVEMTNGDMLNQLFEDVQTPSIVEIEGDGNNFQPCITIIDDDTYDDQIPSSKGYTTVRGDGIGYFSLLLPFTLSLQAKNHVSVKVGLACEGHRVGLTPIYSSRDDYSELNENGKLIKKLVEKVGWEVLCHSMTAQLPVRTFGVESINSELADKILAEGTFTKSLEFDNTIVLDKSTGKWYEVNKEKTAWVERTPTKKYAQLYYKDYSTNNYHINRDFDFDYSWGEWFKRAKELGLPYINAIVYNGSTTSPFVIANSRRYADFGIRTHMNSSNVPPLTAAVHRFTVIASSADNVLVDTYKDKMKKAVDNCIKQSSWLVFMSHSYNPSMYNGYKNSFTYSTKDESYPEEWIIPLNREEILTMDENDYWNKPPERLRISSWSEWHPAPGTQLAAFYDVIEYAISKGVKIALPSEGWKSHGNRLQLGVDMNGTSPIYNIVDDFTNEESSFITVGADGTIRYYKK